MYVCVCLCVSLRFLSQMLIPYKFCDIVSVCNGDIRTNFDPEKLVNEKYKSLSDTFALSVRFLFVCMYVPMYVCMYVHYEEVFVCLFFVIRPRSLLE